MTGAALLLLFLSIESVSATWIVENTTPLPAPAKVSHHRIVVGNGERKVRLHAVTFSAADCTFAIMDDPDGVYDLASAARKRGALAAVNGGYFHRNREPLGLRVRQGTEIHQFEKARLLSGLMTVQSGRISLLRTGEFRKSQSLREAIQAGPFLVDGGRPVTGLNDNRPALRTAIVAGPKQQFGVVVIEQTTLAEAAAILSRPSLFQNWSVGRALNLDGGSSTGLWVGSEQPFYQREWRDVRDFVAIVPK